MAIQGLLYMRMELKNITQSAYSEWHSRILTPSLFQAGTLGRRDGPKVLMHYRHRDAASAKCYLSLCPLKDITWIDSFECRQALDTAFKDETRESLETSFRIYKLTQCFEGNALPKQGHAQGLLEATIQLPAEVDNDYDQWYRNQHLDMLTMMPGYRRSTRYQLLPLHKFQHLTSFDHCDPFVAKHETLHEFEKVGDIVTAQLEKTGRTAWSQRMLSTFTDFARNDWTLVDVHGDIDTQLGTVV